MANCAFRADDGGVWHLFALQNSPVLLVICGFMITWSNAWLTISYHAYQAEVFPTHIRARAVGF